MNKNLKKVGTMVLVAIVAVGAYFVSGTYAKYTSNMSGTGTASVAKWAWIINNKAFTTTDSVREEFTFNPFADIKDTAGADEADVAANLIAPGTSGNITLDIINASEVNAEYKVEFEVTKNTSNIPLEYSLDGTTWVSNIAELNIGTDASNNNAPVAIKMGKSADQSNLQWRWVFEKGTEATLTANDAADTALGFAANTTRPEVEVKATVTVTQVD